MTEDGVDLAERCRQFEPVHIMGDYPVDGIGAEPFVVEFFCWASHSDVLRANPHSVTDAVSWGFMPVNIVKPGHVVGCLDQCSPCLVGGSSHPGREIIQGFELGLTNGFKSKSWVLTDRKSVV